MLLALLTALGCSPGHDTFMLLPLPVNLQPDNLMTVLGELRPTLDVRCGAKPDDNAPAGSGAPKLLVDTGTPLSSFVPLVRSPGLPFRHGQLALYAPRSDGGKVLRLLVCDAPLVRADLDLSEFRLDRNASTTGPLGGVIGGDLLGRFALSVRFAGSPAQPSASLTFTRSDNGPSCQLDDAVLPFRPLGGQLAVQVGDAVITYPATRITIAACVEPLTDPMRPDGELSCLDPDAVQKAVADLTAQRDSVLRQNPVDQATFDRLQRWLGALGQISPEQCTTVPDLTDLGDVVEAQNLLRPAFSRSGVDMQFLVSTAVPDLILSETACSRLLGPERCSCTTNKVTLRLPGLNTSSGEAEQACPIKLGSETRTALSLIARQRHLSACDELARSRRQRYALPQLGTVTNYDSACRHEACLVNLQRESSMTPRRCGYSGLDPQLACDDHSAPVAAFVELGGPQYAAVAPAGASPDLLDALVVPDTARILQSINADIKNDGAQVDGVIGLSVLSRLATTVDYPQARVALSCRCGDTPGHMCRAYRGATYNPADGCSQGTTLQIPADHGRVFCR